MSSPGEHGAPGATPAGDGGPAGLGSVFTPVLLGSASFVFLNFLLPVYTRQLGADAVAIGGMYTAFVVSMLIFRPLVGWALDRFGRRWFFSGAFAFYALAMWTFASAESLADFFIARALQGVGASLMWVSARTLIVDLTARADRGRRMGRLTSTSVQGAMLGAVYGFTLLGMFPMPRAWTLAFLGYAACALLGFLLSVARTPETGGRSAAPEAVETPVLSADLVRLLIIVGVSGFAAALIEPIYLIFLQDRFELSVQALAFAFFPAGIVFAVLPNYTGRLADRLGRPKLIMTGFALSAGVSMALPWLPAILWVALAYTLAAVGRSLSLPAEDALVGDLSPESHRGRVMGYKEAAAALGAALGPPAGGWVYEYQAPEQAFLMNGVLLLAAVALVGIWFQGPRDGPV